MAASRLQHAVIFGDLDEVRRCLANGADPNGVLGVGSLLSTAVEFDRPAIVEALISAGADVNELDGDGITPLLRALFSADSSPAVVRLLLDAGAAASVPDPNHGLTPLEWAARASTPEEATLIRAALPRPADDAPR